MMASNNPNNHGRWSHAEYDRLIALARVEPDEKRRFEFFRKAEEILLDEAAVLPLYFAVTRSMVQPYVKGYYHNVLDIHPLNVIEIDWGVKASVKPSS
jgi:ABC-type transport system substrate-binding protein